MLTNLLVRIRALLQRRRVAREVDDELRFHLEMETASNIERGMTAAEARRQAFLSLGGVVRTQADIRDVRALSFEGILRDARYAIRGMCRRPGFVLLGVATLALGIGVNVASLAAAYGILVRPLPYADASRVVIINLLFADGGDMGFSPRALQEWLPRLRTVESAAGYYRREVTLRAGDTTTVVPAAFVTDTFFDILGAPAAEGPVGVRSDAQNVVVSRRAVGQVFGSDVDAPVGTVLSVSDSPHTVTGIMPSEFSFPDDEIAVWAPSPALLPSTRPQDAGYSKIVARMQPGVSLALVEDDVRRVARELDPDGSARVSVTILGESVVSGLHTFLIAVVVGAFLMLLVACANVATLFLGRDISRERELSARMALGASRGQLVRSVLVECSLFAMMAAVVGTVIGVAALRAFVATADGTISGLHRVGVEPTVVVAISVLTALVTLLCGALPAWHAAHLDFSPFLRTATGPRPRTRLLRQALVVAQIAVSCALLIGAGLLARTVSVLMQEDHGFRPAGALEARLVLSDQVLVDGAGRAGFLRDLVERVRAMPGVQHAGVGSNLPPSTSPVMVAIRLVEDGRDETRFMKAGSVTPGYLPALGAHFVAGDDFQHTDGWSGAPVVIISESVARFYFRDQDPIGRTIAGLPALLATPTPPRVVGVIRDIKYEGLDAPAGSAIYLPWAQRPFGRGYLIVRTHDEPMRLAPAIREVARALDSTVPIPEIRSLDEVIAQSIANRRVRALPAIGFGVLALAVALVGVLATFLALVQERRRELAIRSAIGASPGTLTRTVVKHGIALTAAGLVAGMAIGVAAGRALETLLYRISPFDVPTFVGAALLIGTAATVTTLVAALRARHVDPLAVLRSE